MPKYGKIRGAIRWYSRLPNLRKPIFAPIYSRLLTWVNTVYRGSGGRYSRYFAGGFALRRCRNSIRRYSAAPKCEFRSQFLLLPLGNQIVHFHNLSSTWCTVVSPFIRVGRFSGTRAELKLNSTTAYRSGASWREYTEAHISQGTSHSLFYRDAVKAASMRSTYTFSLVEASSAGPSESIRNRSAYHSSEAITSWSIWRCRST